MSPPLPRIHAYLIQTFESNKLVAVITVQPKKFSSVIYVCPVFKSTFCIIILHLTFCQLRLNSHSAKLQYVFFLFVYTMHLWFQNYILWLSAMCPSNFWECLNKSGHQVKQCPCLVLRIPLYLNGYFVECCCKRRSKKAQSKCISNY